MPPRAAEVGDLRSAVKEAVQSALSVLIELVFVMDKVDEFLGGTALQKALAMYFMFIRFALCALSLFNLAVFIYSLPPRFRMIMSFSTFICLCAQSHMKVEKLMIILDDDEEEEDVLQHLESASLIEL